MNRLGMVRPVLGMVLAGAAVSLACAAEPCTICATAVVTNRGLASCFLDRFGALSKDSGAAVAVDLTDCPSDRGIVDALPTLGTAEPIEPDTQFLLSHAQLDCLRKKLEQPGIELDPQARIDLGTCG